MTREIVASAVLAPDQFGLLGLHRHLPERSLPELLRASARVQDPVRLALFHFAACDTCAAAALVGAAQLCERGGRLVAACHAWRARPEPPG
jgi:hypothetical protein